MIRSERSDPPMKCQNMCLNADQLTRNQLSYDKVQLISGLYVTCDQIARSGSDRKVALINVLYLVPQARSSSGGS